MATQITEGRDIELQDWYGLYSYSWGSEDLTPESFSHPAKMQKRLVTQIFDLATQRGWIPKGGTVIDVFGGVGATSWGAMTHSLNSMILELEPHFVDMAAGCDCPGVTAEDYRRWYGRWKRVNSQRPQGERWCPRCIDELGRVTKDPEPQFPPERLERRDRIRDLGRKHRSQLTKTLKRVTEDKKARRVVKVPDPIFFPDVYTKLPGIKQLGLFSAGVSTSLVYERDSGKIPTRPPHRYEGNLERWHKMAPETSHWVIEGDSRETLTQLRLEGGVIGIGSPPFGGVGKDKNIGDTPGQRQQMKHPDGKPTSDTIRDAYGSSPGQLSVMGLGSPPFAGNSGGQGEASREGIEPGLFDRHSGGMVGKGYGGQKGQLGVMRPGVIGLGSPPFQDNNKDIGATGDTKSRRQQIHDSTPIRDSYGSSDGQLSIMNNGDGPTFWQAAQDITQSLFNLLPPGSFVIWVTKDYVKGWERVQFTQQWRDMCIGLGFEPILWARAWQQTHHGTQTRLDGSKMEVTKSNISFFRLNHIKKNPDKPELHILHEDVWVFRKPLDVGMEAGNEC